MVNEIGAKIQAFAREHAQELEMLQFSTGKEVGDFEIAQMMMAKQQLSAEEYSEFMNSDAGKQGIAKYEALKKGNVFDVAGDKSDNPKLPNREKDLWQRYAESWSEDYAGVKEADTAGGKVWAAVKGTFGRMHKGFETLDIINPLTWVKEPFKKGAELIDEAVYQENGYISDETKAKIKEGAEELKQDGLEVKIKIKEGTARVTSNGIVLQSEIDEDVVELPPYGSKVDVKIENGVAVAKFEKQEIRVPEEGLTAGQKAWEAVKGAGSVVDFLTSTEGLAIAGATVATAGIAGEALLGAAPQLGAFAPALNVTMGAAGVGVTGKGVYDVASAETKEDARKGGAEIASGGMMVGGAVAGAKGALEAARKAGVKVVNPTTLTPMEAIQENVRVMGQGIKVGVGINNPTLGVHLPASAVRMVSKPNDVEAYVTTGKADGIVYEGADGKLYCPNKWSPEQPYEVKKGSVIMIYDKAGGDFAVCDPDIFAKTYVGKASGKYNAMEGVTPGEVIQATKKAVGGVKVLPEGTTIQTLEGPRTIKKGEVVCYDVDGNAYASPLENVFKRNKIYNEDDQVRLITKFSKKHYNIDFKADVGALQGNYDCAFTGPDGNRIIYTEGLSPDVIGKYINRMLNRDWIDDKVIQTYTSDYFDDNRMRRYLMIYH